MQINLSDIDERRFGIRTARATDFGSHDIPYIFRFCASERVELLIARCSTLDISVCQEMEQRGCMLMDTLVYYSNDLGKNNSCNDLIGIAIRSVRPGEEDAVRRIAADAFRGYTGHYHSDAKLDQQKCDEIYEDWAYRSCVHNGVADDVLVAEIHGSLVAFATMRIVTPEEGEGVLFGVARSSQGQGIYRGLIINGMGWCVSRGMLKMTVSTQITNSAVQKVWVRLGFEPGPSFYTFHRWFT